MIALYVILAVVLVIFLLLMLPVGIVVRWKEGFFVSIKVAFVKVRLFPKKEKKIRLRDYSKKNFEKLLERERRAAEKKSAKKSKKKKAQATEGEEAKKGSGDEKNELLRGLYGMRSSIWKIVKSFGGHIRTDVVRADIAIGAEDAAKCAVLYGAASQLCAYILEFLERSTKMKTKKEAISIRADFDRTRTEAEVEFHFSSRVIHALHAILKFGFAYFDFSENNK